jgi:general secretion pathway protein M
MIEQMKAWLTARSAREQWMLAIAGALLASVIAVYGIILPGYATIIAAEKDLNSATERRGRIAARAALLSTNADNATPAKIAATAVQTLDAIISESAATNGFEIIDGIASGADEYSFKLPSAKAGALLVWLTALEAQGIELAEIKMRKNEGDFVSADVRLRYKP